MMVWVVCMAAAALTGCSFPEKRASEGDAALLDASTSDASTSDASMSDAWTSDGAPTWTWQVTDTGVSVALNEVYGVTASDVVAVGQDGTILHWNGSAWQSENAGTFLSLFGIWTNGGESWAVGDRGVLVRSSVRGTWTTATAPTVMPSITTGLGAPLPPMYTPSDSPDTCCTTMESRGPRRFAVQLTSRRFTGPQPTTCTPLVEVARSGVGRAEHGVKKRVR